MLQVDTTSAGLRRPSEEDGNRAPLAYDGWREDNTPDL